MRLRHLVVVIPGIGGSVLCRDGERVWGGGLGDAVALLRDPDRLSLTAHDDLTPDGVIPSTSVLPGWTIIHGYDRLLQQIINAFADQTNDENNGHDHLLIFGYDFRRSIRDSAAELDRRIDEALRRWPKRAWRQRVIVVAHSMGGLVARHWLGPGGGWPRCLALITLGTPHRGAAKALDLLVNGVRLGPRPLRWATERLLGRRFERANHTLRSWPSLYELLPRYPAVLNAATDALMYPHELSVKGFDPDEVETFGERAAAALRVHHEIEAAWSSVPPPGESGETGPQVVALAGLGHPTLETCVLADGRLRVTKEKAEYLWDDDWKGDGTVPGRVAIPIEFDGTKQAPIFVSDRHGPLAATDQVTRLLRWYSGETRIPIRGEEPDQPSVGLGLEELYEIQTDVPVEVQVRNTEPGPQATVTCTLRPAGSHRRLWRGQLDRNGDHWSIAIPELEAGFYEVAVDAAGFVPEPRGTRDRFGVVEL